MNQATTPYHSRWYRERTSTYWWMSSWPYFTFIVREVSSVFVAWTVVFLLKLVNAVAHGAGWYQAFLRWSGQPWVIALNVVALLFVLFHAVTWFNLAPAATGGQRGRPARAGRAHRGWQLRGVGGRVGADRVGAARKIGRGTRDEGRRRCPHERTSRWPGCCSARAV